MTSTQPTGQRVAILGGRGMLGTDLADVLAEAGWDVAVYDLPDWDITVREDLEDALTSVDVVVNCAAFTNVDGAESAREVAMAVNGKAPGVIGAIALRRGVYVIHISTDFVFNGTLDHPYKEVDKPDPVNIYGVSKLEGERALLATGCKACVVRVQWTYGSAGVHFISKFLDRAKSQNDLMMVADQVGSPTWTRDVAVALCELLAIRPTGVYHYAASGYVTRFEVARAILEIEELRGKHLVPCATADFPAPAQRPLNSRFDCSKIDGILRSPRPNWRRSLGRFLAETKAGQTEEDTA